MCHKCRSKSESKRQNDTMSQSLIKMMKLVEIKWSLSPCRQAPEKQLEQSKFERKTRKQSKKETKASKILAIRDPFVSSTSTDCTTTSNEQIIEDYITALNNHESVEEMLQFYRSNKVRVKYDDVCAMTSQSALKQLRCVQASFKDLNFSYESIKEVRPGEVIVENLCVSGTHNGEPYQFDDLPPIEASGKCVALDEECLYFKMRDGKITRKDICAMGAFTGPAGLYQLVGGQTSHH